MLDEYRRLVEKLDHNTVNNESTKASEEKTVTFNESLISSLMLAYMTLHREVKESVGIGGESRDVIKSRYEKLLSDVEEMKIELQGTQTLLQKKEVSIHHGK